MEVEEAKVRPPFLIPDNNLVQLRLRDPLTGEYLSYSDMKARNEKRLAAKTERMARAAIKIKRPQPRYRILQGSLSAKSK